MDMPQILAIIRSADQSSVKLELAITPGLDVLRGHFDGVPIVAGVVQIHWALQLASQYLAPISPLAIERMEAVKFQQVMQPGVTVSLDLALVSKKLVFSYSAGSERYSSGRIPVNL